MTRLPYIIRKEFIQIRRDPLTIRLIMVAPIFQLILFGYAATSDVHHVKVMVCDADRSPESRRITQEIASSYYFRLVGVVDDPREIERALLRGTAQLGVYIPRDFERDLGRGETPQVGLYVDGSDSNTSGVAAGYMTGLLKEHAVGISTLAARKDGTFGATVPTLRPEPRVWYNPELRSINYMVPGVFGLILLVLTVNLGGLAIVKERETGTLEQLMVTPLRRSELILGKMIPFGIMTFVDSGIVFLVAINWFHVPFRGSLVILFSMAAVFLVSNLGLGLLISGLSRSQQEAQILAFLLVMPSVLLSGFMFPIQNMPLIIQYVTCLIPFRYFLEIVRGVFLKGVGVSVLWPQMLLLTAFALALVLLGMAAFRKRL